MEDRRSAGASSSMAIRDLLTIFGFTFHSLFLSLFALLDSGASFYVPEPSAFCSGLHPNGGRPSVALCEQREQELHPLVCQHRGRTWVFGFLAATDPIRC